MNKTLQNNRCHFDLVIFDCDGVLVDSEVISCRAHAEVLTRHGYPISAEQVFHRFLGRSTRQDLGMNAARNHFAVDQHAIAVENDEIEWLAQDLSSSSGTQYNSSR